MRTRTRYGLAAGAVALAVGLGSATYVVAQDPAPERNRAERPGPGRFGGPGRAGGPGMFGGPGRFGGPGGRGGAMGLPLGRLDLSEAQRDQVRTIHESHQAELEAVGARMREARLALATAMTADVFDEGGIRSRFAELAIVEADQAVLQARIRSDVFHQVLTDEQRAAAKKFAAERVERREGRGERRGGRRGPRARENAL